MSLMMLSGCFLFRHTSNTPSPAPPPAAPAPAPPAPKPDTTQQHIPAAAPFHVPQFARLVKKSTYHVALFCPLFLDSLRTQTNTYSWLTHFPSYILPGFEFYAGTRLAVDSLHPSEANIVLKVYDTRSSSLPVMAAINDSFLQQADLIIGMLEYNELKTLAAFSQQHAINLVSATLPNDAEIKQDPFLIIVNSTLPAHAAAILQYVFTNFNNVHLTLWSQPNVDDNTIAQIFTDAYRHHPELSVMPMQQVIYDTSWTAAEIAQHLSPTQNNVCILATLNNAVALTMAHKLASLIDRYQINLMGMPTWHDMPNANDSSLFSLPIFYSSPFVINPQATAMRYVQQKFSQLYQNPNPGNTAYKGFDITYRFLWLMLQYGIYFNARINDPRANMLIPYQFEPVYKHPQEEIPDYFENRNVFFLKVINGKTFPAGNVIVGS